jgi:hypothetical protein
MMHLSWRRSLLILLAFAVPLLGVGLVAGTGSSGSVRGGEPVEMGVAATRVDASGFELAGLHANASAPASGPIDWPRPGVLAFYAVIVVLLAAIAGVAVHTIRTPPGFVRLAEALTSGAIALYGGGLIVMVALVLIGSHGTQFNVGNTGFGSSTITVSGALTAGLASSNGEQSAALDRRMRHAFGPDAFVTDDGERGVRAEIRDPSARVVAFAVVAATWRAATVLWCLLALRSVLSSALHGDPFGVAPVRWMRRLAFGLLLAGPGCAVVAHLATQRIVHAIGATGDGLAWNVPMLTVAMSVLVFALAEVWRYGNVLQREVHATI